jgi:hypothetical protein
LASGAVMMLLPLRVATSSRTRVARGPGRVTGDATEGDRDGVAVVVDVVAGELGDRGDALGVEQ